MLWNLGSVWFFLLASAELLGAPPSDEAIAKFERECKEGIHMSCIRIGTGWLHARKLPNDLKKKILIYLATARMSLQQADEAMAALREAVKIDPCQGIPPNLPKATDFLFRKVLQELHQSDQAPPILTHLPPSLSEFRRTGKLQVKATDDLKVRDITLFYRTQPKGEYQTLLFEQDKPEYYSVQVPLSQLKKVKEFHYYIRARDCAGHSTTNQANANQPIQIQFEGQGSSAREFGGGMLIALGAVLIVGGSLAFVAAAPEQDRLKTAKDPAEIENIQGQVTLYYALGGVGLGLGVVAAGIGAFLLIPPSTWQKKPKSNPIPETSSALPRGQRFVHTLLRSNL